MFGKLFAEPLPPFVIIGQERSGTTLVQTLLSSHPSIHCRGELFDTWQIDDNGHKTTEKSAIFLRDTAPTEFLEAKLAGEGLARPLPKILGFKLLTQHNPKVLLQVIPENPEWRLVYVRRENKLAQFSSRKQVDQSGQWTSQNEKDQAPVIEVAPAWAIAQCNALKLEDELLHRYLDQLPNPLTTVNYTSLSQEKTHRSLVEFLGADPKVVLSSYLKKQGQNHILSRFKNAAEIRERFEGAGLGDWLEDELF